MTLHYHDAPFDHDGAAEWIEQQAREFGWHQDAPETSSDETKSEASARENNEELEGEG